MTSNVILIFIPLFIVMTILVLNSLHKKGWNNLQERYLYPLADFDGEKISIRNLMIEGIGTHNVIRIKTSSQGIYMKMIIPFNLFSKPIMIPWNEISAIQDNKVMFGKYKRLVIGNPFASTIDISDKDYYKISKYISVRN
jgi:hypothetical protein